MKVSVVSDSSVVQPAYGLHPYQRQVLTDLLAHLRPSPNSLVSESHRVIAHMPTGAGKTRVACHVASDLLSQPNAENKIVVWLASTEELCDQAADDLAQAWSHLGNRRVAVHRYWGNSTIDLYSLESGFLVAGLQKLWAVSGRDVRLMGRLAEKTAGVIFDEAHQAVARTYRYLSEQLVSYNPPLLGLTATPGRTSQIDDPDYELATMFGFNKVTVDARGHGNPVTYLIRQGYLADPQFLPVEVTSNLKIKQPREGFDYAPYDLQTIGEDEAWRDAIVNVTLSALRDHRRVMVFCPSVQSVRDCAGAVRATGRTAEIVLGATPDEERRETISRFRKDTPDPIALFNYGVLTAGFDAPRTRCVVVARPTTSLVLYSQMGGRAMRGTRSGGNRTCQIYTVVDTNLPGFGSVAQAFTNWEALWQQE